MALVYMISPGCSYFVTRYQGDQMRARLNRISELLAERRRQARELEEAVIKARRELEEVRTARTRYRREQVQFIEKAQIRLAKIQKQLGILETKLRDLQGKVDGDLKTALEDTDRVLKDRAAELSQLEQALGAVVEQAEPSALEDLLVVVDSLGKSKQWKLMMRYIQLVRVKATAAGKPEYYGKALYTGAYEAYQAQEYPKTVVLGRAYERAMPEGELLPDVLLMMASSQYALENCTPALRILGRFIARFPNHARASEALRLQQTIKSQLHSRQHCAR